MDWPTTTSLRNAWVTLDPLTPSDAAPLAEAVQDGALSTLWYTSIPTPESMPSEIARRLKLQVDGSMLPFTLRDPAGRVLGMTTYMNIVPAHRRLEIGSTWLRASAQRTPVNTAAKLLLLQEAFEAQAAIAVEFRTHFFNQTSRAAIERLGAKLDGILRAHQILPDGSLRDTAVYSITAAEWPAVKRHLTAKLGPAPRTV